VSIIRFETSFVTISNVHLTFFFIFRVKQYFLNRLQPLDNLLYLKISYNQLY